MDERKVGSWIPSMPDIETILQAGGRVADVGCGLGWSCIALAKGFEQVEIDGIDPDELSIIEAVANTEKEGLSNRIHYHVDTIENAKVNGPYELITAFECLHDMPYPVEALRRMKELVDPAGAVLIADEAVEDALEDNMNFMGHLLYNFSVLHCLPQALTFPDAAGTGTVIKPSVLRKYAEQAGYTSVDILPIENPQFRFYRLTP
jgi:2-polyprenyl-3-methyl-5-hydroxy-6-metoxy-1,4-benzoquinol methylase